MEAAEEGEAAGKEEAAGKGEAAGEGDWIGVTVEVVMVVAVRSGEGLDLGAWLF